MVRAAYIEDQLSRLALVSDRAHGVSSQAGGQLEVPLEGKRGNRWTESATLTTRSPRPPGHAPSPPLEQPAVEPGLQPDAERQLGGAAGPVADVGPRRRRLPASPEGGGRAAAQARRHGDRQAW